MPNDLTTEARNPDSENLDQMSTIEIVQLINREDAGVAVAVADQAEQIARAIDAIVAQIRKGGRLVYVGAGTSGRLGVVDASECPPTFNSDPDQVIALIAGGKDAILRAVEGAEDSAKLGEQDLTAIGLSGRDAVVGIAASGRTPYVMGALRYAASQGAVTIGFSCNPASEMNSIADMTITPVVGPEVLSGSTRMKAGTATKLVLNMLTTGAMVRLGKTFGNLMVDLQASNEKLIERSIQIIRDLTNLSDGASRDLLRQCDGELKSAIVCQRLGVDPDQARRHLDVFGGNLRETLQFSETKASDDD